ncbi:mandelate racemase/muconate lactonizing enzyme family protein [Variovorax sp. dw_954]|jgi:L-alanine-DL-glutamate epimerase-like enolase superfamily enzyme|uniref:mandelate racemase/muconate lactonizing enzyme family protein n=1 Tax=Variovorax sp. dw_954 TaxID=2720078 RepID=UPI001BD336C6|nr:mandelate racemase/muconate lactonizing enzyme family protein [Variovorax sp. dw_954]
MKITSVKAHVLKPNERKFRWKEEWAPMTIHHVLLRIGTDEGHEGVCITWLLDPGAIETALPGLRELLIGRDPHEVEAISYKLTDSLRSPSAVASTVDICLWDLMGKYHKEPIYRLLGAARPRIKAYASTIMYDTIPEYIQIAQESYDQGFRAFKLHAFGVPDKDIEVCRAVHKVFNGKMDLMLDPVNAYDRLGAFKVGKVLEELDFYWYEAPIADSDLNGLADLTRSFKIPITAVESVAEGLRGYPKYLSGHVVDSIRSVGDWIGGISAMRKAAGLCEAFNTKYEPHSYGTTLVQAAHLHVMLAIHNCDLFEIPVPQGILDVGMTDVIRCTSDGYVEAPTKPGLGYDIDWDAIKTLTVKEI